MNEDGNTSSPGKETAPERTGKQGMAAAQDGGVAALLEHWHAVSADWNGDIPHRDHFSAERVGPMLDNLALVERTLDGFMIRYLGPALDFPGSETMVGKSFFSYIPPGERPFFGNLLHGVMNARCAVRIERYVHLLDGGILHMVSVDVPLANDMGEVVYALGHYSLELLVEKNGQRALHPDHGKKTACELLQSGISHGEYSRPAYIDLGYGIPSKVPTEPNLKLVGGSEGPSILGPEKNHSPEKEQ